VSRSSITLKTGVLSLNNSKALIACVTHAHTHNATRKENTLLLTLADTESVEISVRQYPYTSVCVYGRFLSVFRG